MRTFLLLFLIFHFVVGANSQNTAADFQKNDCAGVNHHLYAELDSGYVVLLDFIMFDCTPCIIATNALKTIHAQFEASHPGKVRFYSMGFLNYMSCGLMNNWKAQHNYNHTFFAGDAGQVEYYGGMGMPTIVVLGGLTSHKVYYNHQGYTTSEQAPIIQAINLAISESSLSDIDPVRAEDSWSVIPNPFTDELIVSLKSREAGILVLTDVAGREVLRQSVEAGAGALPVALYTGNLRPGCYLLNWIEGTRRIGLRKLIKG